ncbi:hypothetical protein FB451DRAFT_1395315 [Mycena latifolia]|nr:hypothetical protein FB451DRAFT_1395315 [Mycena latifolia]
MCHGATSLKQLFPTLDPDPFNDPVAPYFDIFTLSTLRRLHVHKIFLAPDPVASVASFIARSECKLQEL